MVSAARLATSTVTVHCTQKRPPFLPRRLPKVRSLRPAAPARALLRGGSWGPGSEPMVVTRPVSAARRRLLSGLACHIVGLSQPLPFSSTRTVGTQGG